MLLKLKKTNGLEDLRDSIAALGAEFGSPVEEKQKIVALAKTAGWY